MVEKTPNHKLNKYDQGDPNWTHSPDMQTIEERLLVRDEEGNLENYSPHSGATFIATDTGAVYDGNGSSWNAANRQVGSLTVTDSLSMPSDTSGIKAMGSYRNVPSGIVYSDSGDYVAESFVTNETWTDPNDTAVVLQSMLDAIDDAIGNGRGIGEIEFSSDIFNFDTPVSMYSGATLTGQSWRQSNSQSATVFVPGSISEGRGLIEIGDIGTTNSAGGEATHIRNIYMDLNGQDIAGIYNWGKDRLRTSDVKVVDVGSNGNGILMSGSFNSTLTDSYFVQAALVSNIQLSKDNNSLRMHNVTFNTNAASRPPLILGSSGTRVTSGIFNGVDGPSMNDGLAVVTGDSDKTAMLDSDNRISASDIGADLKRIQFSSCAFVTGGNDVSALKGITKSEITSSRFSSSGIAINGFSRVAINGCRFTGTAKEAIYRSGNTGGSVSTISGCDFKFFGDNNGEPAIRLGSSQAHRVTISGNSFNGNNGNKNDIVLENNAGHVIVTGNYCNSGISATIGSTKDSRTSPPLVVGNSINPVGFSRSTPNLPNGTGSNNFRNNLNPQGAWVHHDGSGVNVESFGTAHSYSLDSSPVFVPRAGRIWFDSSTPSNWDWWWV